ncbi:MAG TPA: serine protease [Phycisphaerae bacterium]|nr:serine protease [Phycisphaerae bacterium]
MTVSRRTIVTCLAAGLAAVVASVGVCAAAGLDGNAVREKVGPRVCLVRVDGALGLPVSYASGFLLGQGKFIVTDLASVAQPGVTQVTAIFGDGTEGQAKMFGMADPALGLIAINVDLPKSKGAGLTLSKTAVTDEGISAAVVGWKWGEALHLTGGILKGSVPAADVAEKVALESPVPKVEFLNFLCPRLDIATGAAVVDAEGDVVGVMVRLMGAAKPLVVPAPLVRQALLAGGTDLKPLAALPNALWPVSLQVTPGEPPTPTNFAAAARLVKRNSLCSKCGGSGKVKIKYIAGYAKGLGGTRRPIIRYRIETCKTCNGDGVLCGPGLYEQFMRMAEGATHLIAAPDTPKNVSDAAFKNGMALLEALGKVPPRYRNALVSQMRADLGGGEGQFPRGGVLYAQVQESVTIRGDRFTVLVPHAPAKPLMVNSEMLTSAYGADDSPDAPKPNSGSWVVVGGVLQGTADVQGRQPVLMRLFGWAFGPALGPKIERRLFVDEMEGGLTTAVASAASPTPATTPETPATTDSTTPTTPPATATPTTPTMTTERKRPKEPPRPRPQKKPGEPSFFGL